MSTQPVSGKPLKPSQLCASFKLDASWNTKDVPEEATPTPFGQNRAFQAIRFSAQIPDRDFNVFIMGQKGFGRHAAALSILGKEAKTKPKPMDWIYVNNFAAPHKPLAISLDPGTANNFKKAMENLTVIYLESFNGWRKYKNLNHI